MASARPPALVLELGFVDGQAGRTWLAVRDNVERLGRAVASGVA
jgi:N-acetylmuramoyl-L-alanine amidase